MLAAAYRIHQGDRVLYVNMESRLDSTWTSALDVKPGENLYIAEPSSGTEALNSILSVIKNNAKLDFRVSNLYEDLGGKNLKHDVTNQLWDALDSADGAGLVDYLAAMGSPATSWLASIRSAITSSTISGDRWRCS